MTVRVESWREKPTKLDCVRRYVLGTAGHVDHGKTTLVRALTGVDTDRLPEEKRRGITIELGFAPWDLGDGSTVSIIDVPGHRRFVHTMIAGASGMETMLLVVAADEGVMPQTREHVAVAHLLGLRRAVVAITKVDKVDPDLALLAGDEARELLEVLGFEVDVVPCSARTGEGLDALRAAVRSALKKLEPPRESGRSRLSVDRAFSVKGSGTVVTGTLVEGRIGIGDELTLAGAMGAQRMSARGLHVHDKAVEAAEAPCRLALNLGGIALEDVHRGDVVTSDASVEATPVLDVSLDPSTKVRSGATVSVHVGTTRATGRVNILKADPNALEGLARLRLTSPIVVFGGDRFVLRGADVDGPSGAVVGGGIVLDARPARIRSRLKRCAVLEALAAADADAAVRGLVAEAQPRSFALSGLASRFSLSVRALDKAIERLVAKHEFARVRTTALVGEAALLAMATRARALVAQHHMKAPLERGLPIETLRQKLGGRTEVAAADEAIRRAASKHPSVSGEPIVLEGDVVRLVGFTSATGASAGLLGAAMKCLAEAGLRGVSEHAMKEATQAAPKEVRALLAKLVRESFALQAGDLWFARVAYHELRDKVRAHLASHGKLTIAEFKEMSGLGRKQAIPLLEQLDREDVTRRQGDDRTPGKASIA